MENKETPKKVEEVQVEEVKAEKPTEEEDPKQSIIDTSITFKSLGL